MIPSRALSRRACTLQVHVVHWLSMSYNWATFHLCFNHSFEGVGLSLHGGWNKEKKLRNNGMWS